jgi:predicted ester cyclase
MPDQRKDIVLLFIEEAWNKGNLAIVDDLMAPHFVSHSSTSFTFGDGLAGVKHTVDAYRKVYPDLYVSVQDVMEDRDKVITRWEARGTQKGHLVGFEPTNQTVQISGISIDIIAEGRIVEHWDSWETKGLNPRLDVPLMQQDRGGDTGGRRRR